MYNDLQNLYILDSMRTMQMPNLPYYYSRVPETLESLCNFISSMNSFLAKAKTSVTPRTLLEGFTIYSKPLCLLFISFNP